MDQADILRNFAAQPTPRGDTFVIRTYGDALDASGNEIARAWCEAVVQRVPDYSDPVDQPHVRYANLISVANKLFGRKIEIDSFRWVNPMKCDLSSPCPGKTSTLHTMSRLQTLLAVFSIGMLPCAAQNAQDVSLRFLSFPKSVDPVKVGLRLVEGRAMHIDAPSNSFSRPVSVASPGVWMVGESAAGPDGKLVFKELGQTKALASPEQMSLIVRKSEDNPAGFDLIALYGRGTGFGGGKFLFMNAAKVDIAGVVGEQKFVVKPGQHTIRDFM